MCSLDLKVAAWVGIDWADEEHAVAMVDRKRPENVEPQKRCSSLPKPLTSGQWSYSGAFPTSALASV